MAGGAEAGAGDQQQVELLGPLAESQIIGLQGPGEEVESAAGLGYMYPISRREEVSSRQFSSYTFKSEVISQHREVTCWNRLGAFT